MIYIYMTLLSVIFMYLYTYSVKVESLSFTAHLLKVPFFLLSFLVICVPGMIRYDVGIDYITYSFHQIPEVLSNQPNTLELFYKYIIRVGYWMGGYTTYQYIFAITNMLILVFLFKYMKDQSENLPLSLIIFMFGGFFAFSLSGMRQAIGVSVALYGLKYIKSNDFFKFILVILFAMMFHKSIVIFIAFYFLKKIEINPFIATGSFGIIYLMSEEIRKLIIYVSDKVGLYSNYFGGQFDNGEYSRLFLVIVLLIMAFLCLSYVELGKETFFELNTEINIHYAACIIMAMAAQLPTPSRLYYLFAPIYITLIPNLINRYKNAKVRLLLVVMFVIGFGLVLYWNVFKQGAYNILPYKDVFHILG